MSLVKSLISTAGKLTGTKFYNQLTSMKLNKAKAIQILAISNGLKYQNKDTESIVDQAKEYLTERCSGNIHTDSTTGLTIIISENGRNGCYL